MNAWTNLLYLLRVYTPGDPDEPNTEEPGECMDPSLSMADHPERPGPVSPDIAMPPGVGTPPRALISGDPKDAEVAGELDRMLDFFLSHGLSPDTWTCAELTKMPKAPGRPCAVPIADLWPNMVETLRLYTVLRRRMDVPLNLRGYRDPSYNKAVGGAKRSIHQWYSALDVYAPQGHRVRLAREAARLFIERPDEAIGFGVYGYPNPSNIHIDTGYKRRTWREAHKYIQLERKED